MRVRDPKIADIIIMIAIYIVLYIFMILLLILGVFDVLTFDDVFSVWVSCARVVIFVTLVLLNHA